MTSEESKLKIAENQIKTKKIKIKSKRRDKSDLGEDFIAPDGGYAWLVCIAAGLSNLCLLAILDVFGLIFQDRFVELGINATQTTTMLNIQIAISSCLGLLNGAMFRRYSYRQISLAGAILSAIAMFALAYANSFYEFLLWFSIILGIAFGLGFPGVTQALNTYFIVNRRAATSYAWTIAGLGPIFLPHLINFLLYNYGIEGTLMFLSGLALHCVPFALLFQPVKWHVKKEEYGLGRSSSLRRQSIRPCEYCEHLLKGRGSSFFSSQYLFTEDDKDYPGYAVVGPGTPMCSRANDGWFSIDDTERKRRISISSRSKTFTSIETGMHEMDTISEETKSIKSNHFNSLLETNKKLNEKLRQQRGIPNRCTCTEKEELLEKSQITESANINLENKHISNGNKTTTNNADAIDVSEEEVKWHQKLIIFFDLDLLKDMTFNNLLLGISLANFNEINSNALTAFYLNEFGFDRNDVAKIMSFQATADIITRFLIPTITQRFNWSNKICYVIGITGLAISRALLTIVLPLNLTLCLCVMVGISRAFRMVFMGLVIPSYVPLKRLPAAAGLQLLIGGILTVCCGPFVGLIKDYSNYSITLNVLNMFTAITLIMWGGESFFKRKQKT